VLFQDIKNVAKKGVRLADKAILNIPLIGSAVRKLGKKLFPAFVRKVRSHIIYDQYGQGSGISEDLWVCETSSAKRYWQNILDEAMLQGADIESRH
jgi:hypothetical protein